MAFTENLKSSNNTKDIISAFIFLAVASFITVGLPQFLLFGFGGGEVAQNLEKFDFYKGIAITFILIIFLFKIGKVIWSKKMFGLNQKNAGFIDSIINDYELGFLSYLKVNFLKKFSNQLIFVLLAFIVLTFIVFFQNVEFTAFPVIEQQVTETADIGLAIEPASTSETIFIAGFMLGMVIMIFFRWLKFRNGWSEGTYWWIVFPTTFIFGVVEWILYHKLRYGDSDIDLVVVGVFGGLQALLLLLFGVLWIVIVFHQFSNLLTKVTDKFAGSDVALVVILSILIFMLVLVVFLKITVRQRSKKKGVG